MLLSFGFPSFTGVYSILEILFNELMIGAIKKRAYGVVNGITYQITKMNIQLILRSKRISHIKQLLSNPNINYVKENILKT